MFSPTFSIGLPSSKPLLSHPNTRFLSSPRYSSSSSSLISPIRCGIRELRERIQSVTNIQKITEAMKLVSAARVRRAQQAVLDGRPFSRTLLQVLLDINQRLRIDDDIEVPLTNVRPVKRVALIVITGDRGLCGGFNNAVVRKAQSRIQELKNLGLDCVVISVGKKGNSFFSRWNNDNHNDVQVQVQVDRFIANGNFPTTKEAQVIADDVFSLFVSEQVDKVELVYTKFVSLINFDPVVHTLLPLSSVKGEVRDVNGNSVDAMEDEFFRLTSKDGKLAVERHEVRNNENEQECYLLVPPLMEFEQDPVQILDAMMPLYLNSQILRALQESLASELAARMSAMSNATDNATELNKNLSVAYNRERQGKITGEILEIVAAAEALNTNS